MIAMMTGLVRKFYASPLLPTTRSLTAIVDGMTMLCYGVESCKLSAILAITSPVAIMSCAISREVFINMKLSFLTLSSYSGAASMVLLILVLRVSARSSVSMNATTFVARTGPSQLTQSNISAQDLVPL